MAILFVGPGGYSTIQAAVAASADGDTIVIAEGTYVEQVVIDDRDNLTLRAADGAQVTIQAPADLIETARSSGDREIHSMLTVRNSLNVTIDNVDFDGHGAGNTVDEGGGAGQANFYGVYFRNSSGTLLDVDITGVRDAYPGGTTAGGQPLVDGVQRGVGLVVDNDSILAFTMTGGSITDFQKQGATFVRADVTITGVTITGGGAQTVIAQNGISINRSTGTISGNTISDIGYAGPAGAYSGIILASSNTNLEISGNTLTGTNGESVASKVVGIWVYQNGPAVSGGEVTGNTVRQTDVGIYLNDSVAPNSILIEGNSVPEVDTTDPYAAGVKLEQNIAVTTPFDTDGSEIADLLRGAAGDDILAGLAGDDILIGNAGNDRLDGGTGADSMTGGSGNDIYLVDDSGDVVTEMPGQGVDEVITTLATYALTADVERLTSSPDSVVGHDFRGNSIDNVVTGNSRNDLFRLQDGGNDAVYGLAGRDVLYFGAAFTPGDYVDAGADSDSLVLQGDYSAGITFGTGTATNIVGVESISLMSGTNAAFGDSAGRLYDYDLTMLDGNVAAGGTIKINGAQLLAGEDLRFNGSAETDGFYLVYGGKGVDTLTGGAMADVFVFSHDGRFGAGDKVDGGGGYDVVYLRGDYTIDFNDAGLEGAFANVESLHLQSAFDTSYAGGGDGELDYNLIWDDALLAAGATMTINGGKLTENESLSFDGSQETNGHFRIFGGAGDDVLRGGSGNDLIYGALGADTMTGGAGSDVFRYQTAADSTVNGRDGIGDFSSEDMIDIQRVDANILVAGDQAFTFIGSAGFNGRAGELQAVANGGGIWTISGDVDGNGQADFQFVVTTVGGHVIGADDFLL